MEQPRLRDERLNSTPFLVVLCVLINGIILACFVSAKPLYAVGAVMIVLALPAGFLFAQKHAVGLIAYCVYLFFSMQLYLQFAGGTEAAFAALLLAFVPCVVVYFCLHDEAALSLNRTAFILMGIGLMASFLFNLVRYRGEWGCRIESDVQFVVGIAMYYIALWLFRAKICTSRKTMFALLICAALMPFFILALYVKAGALGELFSERLGSSTMLNPNYIANHFDLFFPLALFWAFHEKRPLLRCAAATLAAVCGTVLVLCAARGSMIGMTIIGIYFFVKLIRERRFVFLGIYVTAIIIGFTWFGSLVIERVLSPRFEDMVSNLGRLEMLKTSFAILKDNFFLFGIGANSFTEQKFLFGFPLWYDPTRMMSSHNVYMEYWLGWGLPGIAGFIILNLSTAIRLARVRDDTGMARGLFFAVVSFMAHGLFDSIIANFSYIITFFTLFAIAADVILSAGPSSRRAVSLNDNRTISSVALHES